MKIFYDREHKFFSLERPWRCVKKIRTRRHKPQSAVWIACPSLAGEAQRQLEFIDRDLEELNKRRDQTPWLFAYGHRPMYCSDDDDEVAMMGKSGFAFWRFPNVSRFMFNSPPAPCQPPTHLQPHAFTSSEGLRTDARSVEA